VKTAEAMEEVAKHDAKRQLILAEAGLEAADKQAKAKIREAEGKQAQEAAEGLANVRVKEADAVATEKIGMAKVRVQEAEAGAIEKRGMAENTVARERFAVEASGEEQKGLAAVKVKEADAAAVEKQGAAQASAQERQGVAQATAIREKLLAEATGLAEKGKAMQNFAGEPRAHEEFRLQLERDRDVELAQIAAQKTIADAQARVLATALEHAKINIVGGDGAFFDKFTRGVGVAQSIDGTVDHSEVLKKVLGEYLDGKKSLPEDLKQVLTSVSVDDVQKLTLSAFLADMVRDADGASKRKLATLMEKAKELGIQ
jgi:hypothetical protein